MAREPLIKRFLPRGIYGRAALILVLPVVSVTLVVSVTFIQRHFDRVARQMTLPLSQEVQLITDQINASPDQTSALQSAHRIAEPLGIRAAFPDTPEVAVSGMHHNLFDFSGRAVMAELIANLPALTGVDLSVHGFVRIGLETALGPINFEFARSRVSPANPHQLLVLMVFTSLLTSAIAFIFMRNQLRPIRRLAHAAAEFGRGRNQPLRPTGATEVRAAGMAFVDMRARIERQIEQRTLMLSGVSHDLRTPLTRLRLGLSMLSPDEPPEEAEIEALIHDVDDMTTLVDAFLDFARSTSAPEAEPAHPVAIAPFLRLIIEDAARAGHDVTLGALLADGHPMGDGEQICIRETLLRRAIQNLINNGVRYGKKVILGATLGPRSLVIWVEDDGPGIPPENQAEALQPFTRLDPARNQDRGQGVGLGLSIAADAARAHGGQLRFADHSGLGGLRAEIMLPR